MAPPEQEEEKGKEMETKSNDGHQAAAVVIQKVMRAYSVRVRGPKIRLRNKLRLLRLKRTKHLHLRRKAAQLSLPWPLIELVKQLTKMPHHSNTTNNPEHERVVKAYLVGGGYQEKVPTKGEKKRKINKLYPGGVLSDILSPWTFLYQPYGTQAGPDFIIRGEDRIIHLEVKSSKDTRPQYNSGGVNPDWYYLFSSAKPNATTLYRGKDIQSPEQRQMIREYREEEKLRAKQFTKRLRAVDYEDRGWMYYPRAMIAQKGGARYTNYFEHKNRERDEQRALNSLIE
jgi:hypothetical protein